MEWRLSELLFNKYEVSELGNVRYAESKLLKNKHLHKSSGRYIINVRFEGKNYSRKVSRAVATAFIPNPDNLPEVNHLNGVKTDDRVTNLEWSTKLDNIRHAYANNLMNIESRSTRINAKGHKLTKEQVIEIRNKLAKNNQSAAQIAREYRVTRNVISKIKLYKIWKNL